MVPKRSNVAEPMSETLKSIERRRIKQFSMERPKIERRSTRCSYHLLYFCQAEVLPPVKCWKLINKYNLEKEQFFIVFDRSGLNSFVLKRYKNFFVLLFMVQISCRLGSWFQIQSKKMIVFVIPKETSFELLVFFDLNVTRLIFHYFSLVFLKQSFFMLTLQYLYLKYVYKLANSE